MLDAFDVYKTYTAIKLHFTDDKYDYFKYEGNIKANIETFRKRNDRYFYYKLGTKYNKNDLLYFFVSNLLFDNNKYIKELTGGDAETIYLDWKKRNESFEYYFRNDCIHIVNDFNAKRLSFDNGFSVFGGQHPRFFQLVLSKKISYESAVVFNQILSYSKSWDKQITEQVVWPVHSKRLAKYEQFVKYNRTAIKLIMKEVFVK